MPWFKVDDKLHSHRKVIRAGIPAMGLWVVAGSWCADQLGDGFVPDYVAQRLDPDFAEHAAALVAAKLWVPGEKDGETGWYFHQWSDDGRQPTAEAVNAKRDEARVRMAKLRAERAAQKQKATNGSQDVRANGLNTFAGTDGNASSASFDGAVGSTETTPAAPPVRASQASTDHSQGSDQHEEPNSVRANTSRTSREVRSTPTRPDPTVVPTEQQEGEGPRARTSEQSGNDGTPVWAVPLIDQLTAEGFVVTWDFGFVDWDLVRAAIDRSGIPAMIQHVHRRHQASKTAAYSARAWLKGWSKLPALDAGSAPPAPPERRADVIHLPAQRPSTADTRVAEAKAAGQRFAAALQAQQAAQGGS